MIFGKKLPKPAIVQLNDRDQTKPSGFVFLIRIPWFEKKNSNRTNSKQENIRIPCRPCFIKYLPLLCQILKIMFCWSCLCTVSMISAILYDHSVPHLIAKDSNNCDEYCNLSTILEFHEILWPEHQLLPCIWSRIQWLQIF